MTSRDKVAALLVNWNSSKDVLRTVAAIADEYPEVTVIVVDNGSELPDWDLLSVLRVNEVVLVRPGPTTGAMPPAVNEGLRRARTLGSTWAWLIKP
jgi:GT2 family glycosyltransferase